MFNWCMARGLAAANPVRKVKSFREDNTRLRYLTKTEYQKLTQAVREVQSPLLAEKITLAVHTGLRRGNLSGGALIAPLGRSRWPQRCLVLLGSRPR